MKRKITLLLLLAALTSCDFTPNPDKGNDNKEDNLIVGPKFDTPIRNSKNDFTYEDLFNLGNSVDIKVKISDKELNEIQKNYETGYKSEIYRVADLVTISIKNNSKTYTWEYENVGIRQKGNTSRQNIFDGNGNLNLNHYKLSFDETFDDIEMYDSSFIAQYSNIAYKDREFLGLTGLDLKWDKNYDLTHIREAYANYMYRACGVITQNVGLTTFSMIQTDRNNKETSFGLCMLYEPASKSMLKRALSSDAKYINMSSWKEEKKGTFGIEGVNYGDLYKASYGVGDGFAKPNLSNSSIQGKAVGIGNISGSYVPAYERKTNTNVDYDDNLFKTMVTITNNKSYEEINKVVDLDYLAISEAVGYIVGNPDSMRYNYNNYMVYMRRTDGKAIFIPIDTDRCFGIIKDWKVKEGLKYEEIFSLDTSTGSQEIKLLKKTTLSSNDNDCKKMYKKYIDLLVDSPWCKDDTFNKYVNMAAKSYPNYTFSVTERGENYTFSEYMSAKIKTIKGDSSNINEEPDENINTNLPPADDGTSDDVQEVFYDFYICGTFNDWGNYDSSDLSKYKFNRIAKHTYELTLTINKLFAGDSIVFKFNAGQTNWNDLDWTIDAFGRLLKEKGGNFAIYGLNVGDQIYFKINVYTLETEIVIL